MANWAIEHPNSSANYLKALREAIVVSFFLFKNKSYLKSVLSTLLPYGIPSLYLPVRTPPKRGDQTVVPNLLN